MHSADTARPGTRWYSSLHFRIAVGFVVLIAAVLMVQGAVFLWLLERSTHVREPGLTRALSRELAAHLATDPHFDLDRWVATVRPDAHVFVIMTNGVIRGARTPPEQITSNVVADLKRSGGMIPSTWENSAYRAAPIIVDGRTIGLVGIVPPTALEAFGPPMALLGAALLIAGAIVASSVIVGPVRRRTRDLEEAALRLGAGDLRARAHEEGGDEIAQLARSFNRMASELARHAADLEASARARRQLVADVSHELMTPLTTVMGNLETLSMPEVRLDDARRASRVSIAMREAKRLEHLIGDLLDVARLEAGGGDLEFQKVSTTELFELIAAHHEHECLARNISLVPTIAAGAETLFGDAFRLEQALINVTANAMRYSPDGGRVLLTAKPAREGIVAVEVTDFGPGIPPEDLPLIFDRFYKVRPSDAPSHGGGTGLGLSIVSAIVSRHGGRVSASSTVGEGTTIRLELPAVATSAAAVA